MNPSENASPSNLSFTISILSIFLVFNKFCDKVCIQSKESAREGGDTTHIVYITTIILCMLTGHYHLELMTQQSSLRTQTRKHVSRTLIM
jgi:hypothetical protein